MADECRRPWPIPAQAAAALLAPGNRDYNDDDDVWETSWTEGTSIILELQDSEDPSLKVRYRWVLVHDALPIA